MSLLSCNCLNIQIPIERIPIPDSQPPKQLIPERDFNAISSLVPEKTNHIFSSSLIAVPSSSDQTRIKVESLASVQKIGTWVIVRCVNCHIDCYLFDRSPNASTLYANSQLTYNPDFIKTLSGSSDLSPAFGIVICSHPNSSENRDSDVEVSQLLKEKVKRYITQVKQDTDDRIKEFTENETQRFSALERRAWSDFKNILTNIEKESTQLNLANPLSMSPPHLSPSLSISSSNSQDLLPSLTDSEDLPFELDGFMSTGRSDSNVIQDSSDEDEDSDSRSETSENYAHVSRSVPINITSTSLHSRMNDNKVEPIRLEEIHNSMKMLAQSVTDPHYRDLPLPGHYQRNANHF